MRVCRFDDGRVGVVEKEPGGGDVVRDVTSVVEDRLPTLRWPLPPGDAFMNRFDALRPELERAARNAPAVPLASVRLLSPVANPGKIIAAPVNYKLHLDEARDQKAIHHGNQVRSIQEAGVFLKATSSLVGAGEGVVVDWTDRRTDHEIELAVIIGRTGFRIDEADALDYVAGYAMGLDMTIRGPEERSYRKSLDSFTVLGPFMVTADEIADPNALGFQLDVGDEMRQRSNTSLLIFNVQRLIAYATRAYTIHPGDILLTGTPEGVAPVAPGDVIHARMDGIGSMDVAVRGSWDRP